MLDSLPEITTPMKALAFVLLLIMAVALVAWLVRRYGSDRFGGSSGRGRQPRLAVVDAAAVDARRKLVIIRRDNVEHLLMIGGPTDVVVEQNIVRAVSAPRDKAEPAAARGLSASETLARTVPLSEGSMWPLQPQAETNGRRPRTAAEDPLQWTWPTHPDSQRPDRSEPRLETPEGIGALPHEPPLRAMPPSAEGRPAASAPAEKLEKSEKNSVVAESDQTLADLANRLELLPRGPGPAADPPVPVKSESMAEPETLRVAPESRIETSAASPEPKPARAEIKSKAVFESLEEEMANLLGRPPGKP